MNIVNIVACLHIYGKLFLHAYLIGLASFYQMEKKNMKENSKKRSGKNRILLLFVKEAKIVYFLFMGM